MQKNSFYSSLINITTYSIVLALVACNSSNENNPPQSLQIPDKESVGCLVTNDFYAVHFSAYLQPTGNIKDTDRAALLKAYCKELPGPGKAFFSADLIDDDIRQAPIAVKLVEIEKPATDKANASDPKEIRIIKEIPSKIYPKGVVEAQAELDKNGDYLLILDITGEEAITEDSRVKIPFHVGSSTAKPLEKLVYAIKALLNSLFN